MPRLLERIIQADHRLFVWIVASRRAGLDAVMRRVTHLGDTLAIVGATLLLLVLPGTRVAGMQAALTLSLSQPSVHAFKRLVARKRPRLPDGLKTLARMPMCFSFPSGHASASLALALAIFPLLSGVLAFATVLLALTVGLSRSYVGVHYPIDVATGWAIAALSAVSAQALL